MYECEVLNSFNCAFVVSEIDRQWILSGKAQRKMESQLAVLPMGIRPELLTYSPIGLEEASLVMIGNMKYYPNVDGATYFAREVLPLVQMRVPSVRFYVVGASPARPVRALAKLKNVTVTGYLDDPWQIVARAEVVVAPVRLGAGMQNKVLEAMALGKPVVGTTLALQGIVGGQDGEHFVVADSPEQMAERIVDLLRDRHRAQELGRRARTLVEECIHGIALGIGSMNTSTGGRIVPAIACSSVRRQPPFGDCTSTRIRHEELFSADRV